MNELGFWIFLYFLETLFSAWVVKGGGAARLEGTFASGCLVSMFAPRWSADGIRLFVSLAWILSTIGFLIGLFSPEFRSVILRS